MAGFAGEDLLRIIYSFIHLYVYLPFFIFTVFLITRNYMESPVFSLFVDI